MSKELLNTIYKEIDQLIDEEQYDLMQYLSSKIVHTDPGKSQDIEKTYENFKSLRGCLKDSAESVSDIKALWMKKYVSD